AKYLPKNSVLIALNGQGKTRGMVALLRIENATCNQSLVSIMPKSPKYLFEDYLYYQLKLMYQQIRNITGDNQRSGLNIPILKNIQIFVPKFDVQHEIVSKIESERKVIEGCRDLIKIYEEKIKQVINKVWEE
ncbi:MAG TPA: N-6 DNA methylase, partial [Fibrobacteres bacterium]|nr:N-6 DNA methylase [Fibrobacterota bacterium]